METRKIQSPLQSVILLLYRLIRITRLTDFPPFNRFLLNFFFFYKKLYENNFEHLLKKYAVDPLKGNVIDVGANIGFTSLLFKDFVDPNYKILAFEPDEKNFHRLKELIAQKDSEDRIIPYKLALGRGKSEKHLWINQNNPADHRILTEELKSNLSTNIGNKQSPATIEVKETSIDDFLLENPEYTQVSIVKIDVQGYEPEVLKGMKRTVKDNPGILIIIEYCPELLRQMGFCNNDFFKIIEELKLEIYNIGKRGDLIKTSKAELESTKMPKGYLDIVCRKECPPESPI